jgi:hypothetical protein
MAENRGEDLKGERGGDTGKTKRPEGKDAEKGDRRREEAHNPGGQSRPDAAPRNRNGSQSNRNK